MKLNKLISENLSEIFLLILLAFLVYFNSLNNDFVSDDIFGIVNNPLQGTLSYALSSPMIIGRQFFYFVTYNIFEVTPWPYRLGNIVFHALNTALIFLILKSLKKNKIALAVAGLFALHPITVEAVAWISGGVYPHYTFFFLLSLLFYIHNKKYWSLGAYSLSLLTSEKAIPLVAIFFVYEAAFERFDLNIIIKKLWPLMLLVGIWIIFIFGMLNASEGRLVQLQTENYQSGGYYPSHLQIPVAISSYLNIIFAPVILNFYRSDLSMPPAEYIIRIIVTSSAFIFWIYSYKKDKFVFFMGSIFFVSLLPFLTPLKVAWVVAERYAYLATFAAITIALFYLNKLFEKFKLPKDSFAIFIIIIAIILGIRTFMRNITWSTQDRLWVATVKASPNDPKSHNNMGDVFARSGQLEAAAEEFRIAYELLPNYADAHHNYANTIRQLGKTDEAIEHYNKALSINPTIWQSHADLAAIYYERKDWDKARDHIQKALNINPNNANLFLNLALIEINSGNIQTGREYIERLLQIDPQNELLNSILKHLDSEQQ